MKKNVLAKMLPPTDHRLIGLKQNLFFFDEASKGSCFFKPRGARIYNKLIEYLRQEYKTRHYDEVITPNIYNSKLWQTSGHWAHYNENIIKFKLGSSDFSLKPMNCPAHCIIFKQDKVRSHLQLPVRLADFGVLHRNELSGSLTGLSRVRRFQQDDAHIFCTPTQIETEIEDCLDFANKVYGSFGFTFDIRLSLRPENYMGGDDIWNKAEQSLRLALGKSNLVWQEDKYEGAFYGPKIDLIVKDCHQRSQQCATIQLDFQLPERFDLNYKDEECQLKRPVIIHRAILGSIERFIAMLAEHTDGLWPFWMSPLQAIVLPIHGGRFEYAKEVTDRLRQRGFWIDCDISSETFNSKIREAIMMRYNLILIVGDNEYKTNSVTCRIIKKDTPIDTENDCTSDRKDVNSNVKEAINNLNLPIDELICCLDEFERKRVGRADIELLKLNARSNRNK